MLGFILGLVIIIVLGISVVEVTVGSYK
ncbi:Protein of unknown function [Lactobacillus acidophilus DSM 9126]|nr:Protein of unknown function [Lactobacillus acidophilus DSM 9126]